jgi:ABC-2 type transport system ATP-binding protein
MREKHARRKRVAEVLESVGLDDVADRKVKKLSGGMVRRLGVAQALVHEPRVLVVDEPTVGLDPEERLRFRQLMVQLGRDRVILLSTHIVADIGSGCHDMALIDRGKVVFRGSPAQLVSQAKGKVFEVTVSAASELEAVADMEVVSRTAEGDEVTLRAVSGNGRQPAGARAVDDPTLEEAYLSFMAARGRVGVALEEEVSS